MKITDLQAAISFYEFATGKRAVALGLGSEIYKAVLSNLESLVICEAKDDDKLFGLPVTVFEEDPWLLAIASVDPEAS